ncbi:MAG: MmgE/PrpD family protein [Desulfobacteraceae bacterium]|jgi:2-methylcitrate dehydratase PrpD
MATLTGVMGEYLAQLRFEDLPKDVIERARLTLLDSIGCALGAGRQTSIIILENFILSREGYGKSIVFGNKKKTSLTGAILLNASRADALEFSDVNKLAGGHPGCMVVPTAINMAEAYGASGKDLLLAIVIGYEAHRLAIPLYPQAFRRGIHLVMFGGTLGSCAVAGNIMGLDADEMSHALGICGVVPVAPFEPCRVGGDAKDLYTGWAAMTGANAALLAKSGFKGTDTLFEGELGLYRALGAKKDPETAIENLGKEWVISKSCVKPHASCRFTHSSADAALAITNDRAISSEQIEHITITTDTIPYQLNRGPEPRDAIDARFSIPFVFATALLNKRFIEIEDFSDTNLKDERITRLAKKVEVRLDRALDKLYPEPPEGKGFRTAIVEIQLKDGSQISERVDYPKGDPANPVSWEEVKDKFRTQAQRVLSRRQIDEAISTIEDVEKVDAIGSITALLVPA